MLLVDFYKTKLLIEETRLVKKSRMKPGKEPHAAREPRVGHPWFRSTAISALSLFAENNLFSREYSSLTLQATNAREASINQSDTLSAQLEKEWFVKNLCNEKKIRMHMWQSAMVSSGPKFLGNLSPNPNPTRKHRPDLHACFALF